MKHHLHYEQFLEASMEEVWNFFSNANNLETLTPPKMKMNVRTKLANPIVYKDMRIAYTVAPLFGIPVFWETKIIEVEVHSYFIDIQRRGPFKSWKHTHTFIQQENGVMMNDDIEYELPLGKLGDFFHQPLVLKNLKELFVYRQQICKEIF
jgi:Uncharacterized conserved protein